MAGLVPATHARDPCRMVGREALIAVYMMSNRRNLRRRDERAPHACRPAQGRRAQGLHPAIWPETSRVVRGLGKHLRGHSPRKIAQEVQAGMENQPDRTRESNL